MAPMDGYRRFLLQHSQVVTALEALVPSITWCLPERFSTSEIPAESLNTLSGLISVLNEHVLSEFKPGAPKLLLACIHQVEVLLEITANSLENTGTFRSKYSLLLILEAIKAAIRGKLLCDSQQMVLVPHMPSAGEQTDLSQDNLARAFHRLRTEARKAKRAAQQPGQDAGAANTVPAGYWWTSAHTDASGPSIDPPNAGNVQHVDRSAASAKARIRDSASEHVACNTTDSSCPNPDAALRRLPKTCWFFWQDRSSHSYPPQSSAETAGAQTERTHETAPASASTREPGYRSGSWEGWAHEGSSSWPRRRYARRLMLYGEVLHIVRPVIYVAFLRRFGRRSWVPWLVSLVCDIVGQCATARGLAILEKIHGASCPEKGHYSASPFMCTSASTLSHMARLPISSVERRELSRRLWMLLWYLMRDPLYARAVSPQLERVHTFVGLVPILGFLSRRCLDIVEGVQQYYVYTSAS